LTAQAEVTASLPLLPHRGRRGSSAGRGEPREDEFEVKADGVVPTAGVHHRLQSSNKLGQGQKAMRKEFVVIAAVVAVALIGYLSWQGTQEETATNASAPQSAATATTPSAAPAAAPQNAPATSAQTPPATATTPAAPQNTPPAQ
jgi:Flp pilus assembly pilin Flp